MSSILNRGHRCVKWSLVLVGCFTLLAPKLGGQVTANFVQPIPRQHYSTEPVEGAFVCYDWTLDSQWFGRLTSTITFGLWDPTKGQVVDIAPLVWEWTPVNDVNPVTLEGVVVGEDEHPGVSFEDNGITHYTHDFNFKVLPDAKPQYTNLLGLLVDRAHDPCPEDRAALDHLYDEARALGSELARAAPQEKGALARQIRELIRQAEPERRRLEQHLHSPACQRVIDHFTPQREIEIEWESGLGADNDGNTCSSSNRQGDSCGFYSAGHRRGATIWNWPVLGDRVYMVGDWIWDRGHSPVTEIHPPHFIAIERHLPEVFNLVVASPPGGVAPPPRMVLSTRVDIFANADGNAYRNNRHGDVVTMGSRDYVFQVGHRLPRPSPTARLRWFVQHRPGDSFSQELVIRDLTPTLGSSPADSGNTPPYGAVEVQVPWMSKGVPNSAVLARTITLYWDEGHGVPNNYQVKAFRVTLDELNVAKTLESTGDGEYRVFAQVGSEWMFVNELFGGSDILRNGLGDVGGGSRLGMNRSFDVYVPSNDAFDIYLSGWEADGVNDSFGKIVGSSSVCPQAVDFVNDNLLTGGVYFNGGRDDPIGVAAIKLSAQNNFGVSSSASLVSAGKVYNDDPVGPTDPNGAFSLRYHIRGLPLPWGQLSTAPIPPPR
jgi:hypothetical protein